MTAIALLTLTHVAISLVGIGSGFIVIWGFFTGRRLDGWTAVFLTATVATSATGFLFPAEHFTPGHALGILSLLVLTVAIVARYSAHLAGGWRAAYVVSAVISQYLNMFVLVVQSFRKVPALRALAPTQNEPAFMLTQVVLLAVFVLIAVAGSIRFRNETVTMAH